MRRNTPSPTSPTSPWYTISPARLEIIRGFRCRGCLVSTTSKNWETALHVLRTTRGRHRHRRMVFRRWVAWCTPIAPFAALLTHQERSLRRPQPPPAPLPLPAKAEAFGSAECSLHSFSSRTRSLRKASRREALEAMRLLPSQRLWGLSRLFYRPRVCNS